MKVFNCPACGSRVFFDNLSCPCGATVAFDPEAGQFATEADLCANRPVIGCNWIVAAGDLCGSCLLTSVHPDLGVPGNQDRWRKAENAKRLVLAGLRRWGWFGLADTGGKPQFQMLSEATAFGPASVTMGHASGVVTINLAESDDVERVRRREALGEPYRTMVGHFRHEIAHFLFERLSATHAFTAAFRERFGDERADYSAALAGYYREGPAQDWAARYITPYASAHPHEDWAESAAHALHLVDMVDSFTAIGLSCADLYGADCDAYQESDPSRLLNAGTQIGVALNHVNRALGVGDLYPFVTPDAVLQKLAFAQTWLRRK